MLRKILLLFGLCVLASLPTHAQDEKFDLFGGYSYMRFRGAPSVNLNGWEVSCQYKFNDWLGGVGDFDGHYGSGTSTQTFLFGPQISYPASVSPFAHLLLGGAHFSANGFGDTSFSMALGGGIDATMSNDVFHWRIFQADYVLTQFHGGSQNNLRISTGILFRF